MYGVTADGNDVNHGSTGSAKRDIEAAITQEVEGMKSAKKDDLFRPVRVDIACGKLTALWRGGLHSDAGSLSSPVLQNATTHRTRISSPEDLLGCLRIIGHQEPSLDQETDPNDEDGEGDGKGSGRGVEGGARTCIP